LDQFQVSSQLKNILENKERKSKMEYQEIIKKLEDQEKKIDEIYKSVEKTRKYFLAIIIISVVAFVLPLIGMIFAVPALLNSYTSVLGL
jgi:DNA-directed RNA polymerase specialized sigma subunit